MVKRTAILLVTILLMTNLSSCWDLIDIEERAFVVGVGIDTVEGSDKVLVTFQIALQNAFTSDGGGDGDPFWNIKIETDNYINARKNLIKHINWIPIFEHCKIIIFGEEYAKKGITDPLDYFVRAHDIRRLMQIAVVKGGRAETILDTKLKNNRIPSMFISDLMTQNSKKNMGILSDSFIGRLHENFILISALPITQVSLSSDETLSVSGSAIFNDEFKLEGWFDSDETVALGFLRGDKKIGFLGIDLPDDRGKSIMLNVFNSNAKVKPEFRGERLYMVLKVRVEGDILEIGETGYDINNISDIEKFEELISQWLENLVYKTYKKAQDEFKSEPFELDIKMMNYYPDFWQKNKNNWEYIFENTELEVDIDTFIRRVGDVNY